MIALEARWKEEREESIHPPAKYILLSIGDSGPCTRAAVSYRQLKKSPRWAHCYDGSQFALKCRIYGERSHHLHGQEARWHSGFIFKWRIIDAALTLTGSHSPQMCRLCGGPLGGYCNVNWETGSQGAWEASLLCISGSIKLTLHFCGHFPPGTPTRNR